VLALAIGERVTYVKDGNHRKGAVTSLAGQLLVAMPAMQDHRFARSVIYLCEHTEHRAMGLVVNKLLDTLTLPELMQHLGLDADGVPATARIHFGGPVEVGHGFVLHSADYVETEQTHLVGDELALTATLDILRAIGRGTGPRHSLIALGYAGWGPGQLDAEIQANAWLHVAADESIVFGPDLDDKWQRAMAKLGVDLLALSGDAGHA
jgi:putative transcriptional regulator